MDIHVVGRHTKVAEEFRAKVLEKLKKIETLDPSATRIDVHVVHERSPHMVAERERIELTVHGRGPVIRTEAAAEDRVVALELASDRLIERIRKLHERRAHRHQNKIGVGHAAGLTVVGEPQPERHDGPGDKAAVSVERWEGAPESATREIPLAGTPIIIRSKTHSGVPMTTPDAIDQMELVGHDFFLFHDSETGLPSAVYRRRGWTYGVIHLEAGPQAAKGLRSGRESIEESA
jgi:ribosomal subunit interface protein